MSHYLHLLLPHGTHMSFWTPYFNLLSLSCPHSWKTPTTPLIPLDPPDTPGRSYHLFILDIYSLYTSIPHSEGLKALKFFLDRRIKPAISIAALAYLVDLVLTLNASKINGGYFNQISGVAIGTKMGPSYACYFLGYLEHLVWKTHQNKFPLDVQEIHWWWCKNNLNVQGWTWKIN